MSDSRSSILTRIRTANGSSTDLMQANAEWASMERDYQTVRKRDQSAITNLLVQRLRHYDAEVQFCSVSEMATALRNMFEKIGARSIAIPPAGSSWDLPQGFDFLPDNDLSIAELDRVDAVLTACALAIAETGTLVLQNDSNQGRRALTLIPDVHICLIAISSIVETVPEAFARLRPTADLPTTFVSGPSATADIEMTRVKGVHGPRFLHVLLVGEEGELRNIQ